MASIHPSIFTSAYFKTEDKKKSFPYCVFKASQIKEALPQYQTLIGQRRWRQQQWQTFTEEAAVKTKTKQKNFCRKTLCLERNLLRMFYFESRHVHTMCTYLIFYSLWMVMKICNKLHVLLRKSKAIKEIIVLSCKQ